MVFDSALALEDARRAEFVADACGDDRDLIEEVMALLRYEAQAGPVKTANPFGLAAEALDVAEAESMIGQTIGRYRLEAQIASGGMGRVFKARRIDGDVEQIVALKLIRRELFNEALLRRFSDERRILASLNHPGIAHFIDAGPDAAGSPFIAMEYVDGAPLLDYCARHRLSVRDRLMLFRQLLAAVAYAHRNLVVHRDLKPDNVLVTSGGHAKLLDFGVSKALIPEMQRTRTEQRFFTPAYAAPEQMLGQTAAVVCDVYGLGAILYAMLAGVAPFDLTSLSAGEVERMILKTPPSSLRSAALKRGASALSAQGVVDLSRWAARLDGDLDNIVQKALRKEPGARYDSVDAFDADLQRFLSNRPVAATGAGWIYRGRKFCERNVIALAFVAVMLAVCVIAVGQNMRQNDLIREERDRAQYALKLLRDSFIYADPGRQGLGEGSDGSSDDPRARAILFSAAREIGEMEKQNPELFREMAYQVGSIQLDLGMTQAGIDLIRRANRSMARPPDDGILLELRGAISASNPGEARRLIARHGARLRALPEFAVEEARLLYMEDHYPDAVRQLESLLSGDAVELNDDVAARAYLYLVEAYRLSGETKKAVDVLDRHVTYQSKRFGADHPRALILRLRRAESLTETTDDSIESELVAIKPALDRYYDQGSAVQAVYHNVFGQFLSRHKRPVEALAHFRRSLDANLIALGPGHENTLRSHLNAAVVIAYSQPDRSSAYPHFQQAIVGFEKTKGLSYSLIGFARLEAAKAHYWDGNPSAAKSMLTPAHASQFIPHMTEINRKEYLAALHHGFGSQDCRQETDRHMAHRTGSEKIARALICRYDPKGENTPKD